MESNQPPTDMPSGVPSVQPIQPPPPGKPGSTSTNTLVSLILGILALTCCGFFTGIPAIFLANSELKAVQEGRIPESNRTMAKVGLILGIIGTVLSCLTALAYVAMMAFGLSAGMLESGSF